MCNGGIKRNIVYLLYKCSVKYRVVKFTTIPHCRRKKKKLLSLSEKFLIFVSANLLSKVKSFFFAVRRFAHLFILILKKYFCKCQFYLQKQKCLIKLLHRVIKFHSDNGIINYTNKYPH
jgi:hypothetical protein